MRTYTIEMLSKPEIYQLDSELATVARKAAVAKFQEMGDAGQLSLGDIKRQFLNGEHAALVFERLNAAHAAEMAAIAEHKRMIRLVEELSLPTGVAVTIDRGGLKIKAPYDGGDLNRRLNKKGGHWNQWDKCIDAPLAAVESLPKILSNWAKAQGIAQQEKATAEAQRQAKIEAERKAQRLAWDEENRREAEQRKAAQQAEDQRRAKAVANRVQVTVGEYKIGDVLNGRQITGFGKSWEEATLSSGQLYQPCDYGRCEGEPVCVNCFKCEKHCGCDSVTVCYAYFE